MLVMADPVIAGESEAIQNRRFTGLLRRVAPLRKRFAFVAGNDARLRVLAA